MPKAALVVGVHGVGMLLAVFLGGALVGFLLRRLRLGADELTESGLYGAGRVIGQLERFLIYLAVVANATTLIVVVIGAKTVVRFPELTRRDDSTKPGEDRPASFVEYYLVGTLASLAIGVTVPLLVQLLLTVTGYAL